MHSEMGKIYVALFMQIEFFLYRHTSKHFFLASSHWYRKVCPITLDAKGTGSFRQPKVENLAYFPNWGQGLSLTNCQQKTNREGCALI